MEKISVFLIICIYLAVNSEAKIFTRCGLVKELRNQGFPESQLRNWVCLIEHESSRNTALVAGPNYDGSRDYGLFQINDRYWCSKTSTPGKDCNVRCSDLILDNITKASKCAKIIYKRHNFNAWYGWKNNCQKAGSLPDISKC